MDASLVRWVGENFGLVALAFTAIISAFIGFLTWLVRRFMTQQEKLAEVFRAEAKEERKECRERHEAAMEEIRAMTRALTNMAVEVRSLSFRGQRHDQPR